MRSKRHVYWTNCGIFLSQCEDHNSTINLSATPATYFCLLDREIEEKKCCLNEGVSKLQWICETAIIICVVIIKFVLQRESVLAYTLVTEIALVHSHERYGIW